MPGSQQVTCPYIHLKAISNDIKQTTLLTCLPVLASLLLVFIPVPQFVKTHKLAPVW